MALQMVPSHLSFSILNLWYIFWLNSVVVVICIQIVDSDVWLPAKFFSPVYSHIWLWCIFCFVFLKMELFKEGYHNLNLMLS